MAPNAKDHPDHGSLRPPKRIALIFDEWGLVVGDENSAFYFNQQNSLRDALAAASTLNSR
jgi:hypothetical protein